MASSELQKDIAIRFLGDGAEELVVDLSFVDELAVKEVSREVAY